MSQIIEVVYHKGSLKPLAPMELSEGQHLHIIVVGDGSTKRKLGRGMTGQEMLDNMPTFPPGELDLMEQAIREEFRKVEPEREINLDQ